MRYILTTCPFCGTGCNLYLEISNGKLIASLPSRNHPISRGRLCVKGWNVHEAVMHPQRLRSPLIKKNGKWLKASWPDALGLVAKELKRIKEKFGPDSLGIISSARSTNEENYLIQKFSRAVLGTNNIDHCARTCHSATVAGLVRSFGSGAMTNSVPEIEDAKCIFVIGSNTLEAHPIVGWRLRTAKDRGAKIIVADPRKIDVAKFADIHLQLIPGTDIYLVNTIMNLIVSKDLHNKEFVQKRTEGFEEFYETIKKYNLEEAERITHVPEELLVQAAQLYAKTKPASIIYSLGITEHSVGTHNVMTLANLALLCGNLGIPSSGVNPLRGQNNVQGACDMAALPNYFPGYQVVENTEVRAKFENAWGVKLSRKKGLTSTDMFTEAINGKIKSLYVIGEDIMVSEPDVGRIKKALKKLEFLVVHDLFFCETAKYANVILPVASFAEKEGTFTNTDRRIQRVRKAIAPLKGTMADGEIIIRLAELMGYSLNSKTASEIMDEIASLCPVFGGVSYARLDKESIQWPCPGRNHRGTKFLHQQRFSRGLGKFWAIEHEPPKELPDSEYPFVLTTGRMHYHYNAGTMTRRTKSLNREFPENFAEINPQDALNLGIKNKAMIRISTRRGTLAVRAKVTDEIVEGVVWMPFHFAETPTNILTNSAFCPISKIGEYKACAARVEPLFTPLEVRTKGAAVAFGDLLLTG